MYKIFLFLLLILLSCILISCKYKNYYYQDDYQVKKWKKNQKSLLNIKDIRTRGIVICNFYNKKIRLQFFFQNIDHNYRFVFTDPIGFRYIIINVSESGSFSIRENIRNYFYSCDFEKTIQKLINEHMFLKNLQGWIIGLPGTSVDFNLDIYGHLKKINYQYNKKNFLLLYKSYYDNIIPSLPKVVEIYFDKNYYFNIKFYTWNIQ